MEIITTAANFQRNSIFMHMHTESYFLNTKFGWQPRRLNESETLGPNSDRRFEKLQHFTDQSYQSKQNRCDSLCLRV